MEKIAITTVEPGIVSSFIINKDKVKEIINDSTYDSNVITVILDNLVIFINLKKQSVVFDLLD